MNDELRSSRLIQSENTVLQSISATFEDQDDIMTFAELAYQRINKQRHDIFLAMVQEELGVDENSGDVNAVSYVINHFIESGDDDKVHKIKSKITQPPFDQIAKLTPDIIMIDKDDDGNEVMTVIDVAVSVDPNFVRVNKVDKYKRLKEVIIDPPMIVVSVVYDINRHQVLTFSDPASHWNLNNLSTVVYDGVVQRGEQLKRQILSSMDNETAIKFQELIKNSKTINDVLGYEIKNLDFAMTVEEFEEFILYKSKSAKKFFTNLKGENAELMFRSFRFSDVENDEDKIYNNLKGIINVHNIDNSLNDKEYFNKMNDDLFKESESFVSKNIPEEPTSKQLEEAYESMKLKSKGVFKGTMKHKIMNPLYLNFSMRSDLSKNVKKEKKNKKLIKKYRMERLYNKIKESRGDEDLIRALSLILKPSSIKDDEYLEYILSGERYVYEDGTTISKEDFIKKAVERNKNHQKLTQIKEEHPTGIEFMNDEKKIAIAYKKGEIISIKPDNIKEVYKLLDSAGVGRKMDKEEVEIVVNEKVESLPFWDDGITQKICDEFDDRINEFTAKLIKIGGVIDEKLYKEFDRISTNSEGESSEGSDLSTESDKDENQKSFEKGMKYFMRHHEILWENISFCAQVGGKGFRIVQGITDNSFVIVFPCEAIMKGYTGVPFINVSIVEENDVFEDFLDRNSQILDGNGYKIVVSKGRRLQRSRITGHLDTKPTFYGAVSIINKHRLDSKTIPLTMEEQSRMSWLISNININTSAIEDSIRYMIDNTMADYSFCKRFIEEKFVQAVKNHGQMYLYKRSKELLFLLREETSNVKVKRAIVTVDGDVDIDMARVVKGSFPSLLSEIARYSKPDMVIAEIYTLFFSVPKGQHDEFHNLIKIHKTPLEIEHNIKEKFKNNIPIGKGEGLDRFEFDPRMVVLSSFCADDAMTSTFPDCRNKNLMKERMDQTPLRIKTMCSTRSVIVKDRNKENVIDESQTSLDSNPFLSELSEQDQNNLQYKLLELQNRVIRTKSKYKKQVIWKRFKKTILDDACWEGTNKDAMKQIQMFIEERIKMNFESSQVEYRINMAKNEYKFKMGQIMKNKGVQNPQFYTSGTVLLEVLKDVKKENILEPKSGNKITRSSESIGVKGKKAVLEGEPWVFAVRKKGQRTKDDREIFVANKPAKYGLYCIEHTWKTKCSNIIEERISEPGDEKIISMMNQVKGGFEWMSRELDHRRNNEETPDVKYKLRGDALHYNVDMTKWAPKDNSYKFLFTIASCKISTIEEKFFFMSVIFKMLDKKLYIDEEIMYKLSAKESKFLKDEYTGEISAIKDKDIFSIMTKGFKRNLVPISLTWFQGQLNFMSSHVHTGGIILLKQFIQRKYRNVSFRWYLNAHSDDEQIDVYFVHPDYITDHMIFEDIWNKLDFISKLCCMELSNKKSNVSKMIKQFVSQYNIAGEQIYLWCKPLMSSISGCPYTTIKDDLSSMLSKLSEALSKGAPKSVVAVFLDELKLSIWDLYGIRTDRMKNKFAKLFDIDEEDLPMAFGGCYVEDFTTLAIGGPKTVDQMNLSRLLRYCGATTEYAPSMTPKDERKKKALKLFQAINMISSDTVNAEEDVTASNTLNIFKTVRFAMKRTGFNNPLRELYGIDMELTVSRLKETKPGLGLIKPKDIVDLMHYYMIILNNENFKASMAGRSQAVLKLHKIINRNKGVFRLKKSGNITLEKFEEENLFRVNFTAEKIAKFIKDLMKDHVLTVDNLVNLQRKYITSDPEFKILNFSHTNSKKSVAALKKNTVAKMKPSAMDYSQLVNSPAQLLCYFFDYKYFIRNFDKLRYPSAIANDLIILNEMFPVPFARLRELVREWNSEKDENTRNERDFSSYMYAVDMVRKNDSDLMRLEEMMFKDKNILREENDNSLSLLRHEIKLSGGGRATELEVTSTIREVEEKVSVKFDLFARLVKCSQFIETYTKKVLFCAPTISNELHDVYLALKSNIESTSSISLTYTLNINQKQTLKSIKLATTRASGTELIEYVKELACLVSLMSKLKINDAEAVDIVRTSKLKSQSIAEVGAKFKNLPHYIKRYSLLPLSMVNPNMTALNVSRIDPMVIKWLKAESIDDNSFEAMNYYKNLKIHIYGKDKRINGFTIYYSKELNIILLDSAIKKFLSDLHFRDRTKSHMIIISSFMNVRARMPEDRKVFGYSSHLNCIVSGKDPTCNMFFQNGSIEKVHDISENRSINVAFPSFKEQCVVYNTVMDNESQMLYHKYPKTTNIVNLTFEDRKIMFFYLSDLAKKSLYRPIMSGKFYDIQFEDAIKYTREQYAMVQNFGTEGANYCYDLLSGNWNQKGEGMTQNRITKYIHKLEEFEYEDSDTEDSDSDEDYQKKMINIVMKTNKYFKVEGFIEYMNNAPEMNRNNIQALLDSRMKNWSEMMSILQKFDLRSVTSTTVYLKAIKDVMEKDDDIVDYKDQLNKMINDNEKEIVKFLKQKERESDMIMLQDEVIRKIYEESRISPITNEDVKLFNLVITILHTMALQEKKNIFELLVQRAYRWKGSDNTSMMLIGIACMTLGHFFFKALLLSKGQKIKPEAAYQVLKRFHNSEKKKFSPHVLEVFNHFEWAWVESHKERNKKKGRDLLNAMGAGVSMEFIAPTNGSKRKKKNKKSKKLDEEKSTKSVRKVLKNNEGLLDNIKDDPDTLINAIDMSRNLLSTDFGTSDSQLSEADMYMKRISPVSNNFGVIESANMLQRLMTSSPEEVRVIKTDFSDLSKFMEENDSEESDNFIEEEGADDDNEGRELPEPYYKKGDSWADFE